MKNTKSFREYLEGSSLFKFDNTTGQVIPVTSDLVNVWTVILANIFGIPEASISGRFNESTPFGRLVEALAIRDQRACAITAAHANQINPSYATGQVLDAIASFFKIQRNGATPTKISLNLNGTPNTIVPQGTKVKNAKEQIFLTDYEIKIPEWGSVVTSATSELHGKIDFEIGSVTKIVDDVEGLDSVSDNGIIVAGYNIETDNNLRNRIINARWTGTAFTKSILSKILKVDGVGSAVVIDNGYGETMYLWEDGELHSTTPTDLSEFITIDPHSILVVADASAANIEDVAKAVFDTKPVGCGYTVVSASQVHEVIVNDGAFGYRVIINTPETVAFDVDIVVKKNQYTGSNEQLINEVKSAVLSWANGEIPNVDGISIGQYIYPFEIGSAISDSIKSIQIKSVSLKDSSGNIQSVIKCFVDKIGTVRNVSVTVE